MFFCFSWNIFFFYLRAWRGKTCEKEKIKNLKKVEFKNWVLIHVLKVIEASFEKNIKVYLAAYVLKMFWKKKKKGCSN